jgi:hypothetical protein
MRPSIRLFVILAMLPGLLYAALHEVIDSVAYPPPIYSLFVLLYATLIPGDVAEIIVAAIAQVLLFVVLNGHLLSRRGVSRRLTVWIVPVVALVLATWLQVSMSAEAWMRPDYPGARASVVVGGTLLAFAVTAAIVGIRRSRATAPQFALAVNCFVHCGAVAVLFPYVGELP